MTSSELWGAFVERIGLVPPNLPATVVAVSQIPYGRPERKDAVGVVHEWRGTCSTKHLLLATLLNERWPDRDVQLWHRVYRVTPEFALGRWGPLVAARIPSGGLVDVHTYATVTVADSPITVDVTFTIPSWDGVSSMVIAGAAGDDYPAGEDPLAHKEQLVRTHCAPDLREPFISALTALVT
jgi:hypothetical protein